MSALTFQVAERSDEPDLRRLLRENPLGGSYAISLEREPDAFAADFGLSERHDFVVARRNDTGEAVGMCEQLVAPAFVDGKVVRLPYIGGLRVARSHRHRIAVLRGGFAALRQAATDRNVVPFALTSIAIDNDEARRLLTAGLPGLPQYTPADRFSTFLLRPRKGQAGERVRPACDEDMPALAAFLQERLSRYQFAPVWTAERLLRCAPPQRFLLWRDGRAIRGSVCVWDQRSRRQTVVRSYPSLVARLRRLLNLLSPIGGFPAFPPKGSALAAAFLSHLATEDDPTILHDLLRAALSEASRSGLKIAVLGCARAHPWRELIRRTWRCVEYRTDLYRVHWDAVPALGQRLAMPEVALL
ncbi:MAG: hypothetical protein U1E56_04140 [Bauldia sp.]